jgi:glycosyltransferase involved in cell wall biosynthesis
MKLLFVLENYLPYKGGAELMFSNIMERLVKEGHQVDLITHRIKGTQAYEQINGVNVHRVRCLDSRHIFTFSAVPKSIKLAKNADIIQTTTFNGAPPAWLAAKIRRKPVILTVLEVWIGKWAQVTNFGKITARTLNFLEKCIFKLPYTHYACISEATRKDLLKIGVHEEKTSVIYNGLDNEFWQKDKFNGKEIREKYNLDRKYVLFSWGRVAPSKGFEYAVSAMPEITKKIPTAVMLLMLSNVEIYPGLFQKIKNMIQEQNLTEKVIIIDPAPYKELGNYISAADCIIIPSISEGFGYTTVEACMMEKPVVATDVGSIPEVISGKHVLSKPRDPESIAESVVKVFESKAETLPLKRFEWDNCIKQYNSLYKKITTK